MSGTSVMGAFRRAVDATGMIWKDPKGPEPETPPPPPDRTNADVQNAAAQARNRRRSLLALNPTGGAGVTGAAPVQGKTLLGQA